MRTGRMEEASALADRIRIQEAQQITTDSDHRQSGREGHVGGCAKGDGSSIGDCIRGWYRCSH